MSLRAAVVIDYQNVHLTAYDVFAHDRERHDALIHPVRFAKSALAERNRRQRPGYPDAELAGVHVFRGLPHADYDPEQNARCLAQAHQWRSDGARVELRDLKYKTRIGADGNPIRNIYGRKEPVGRGQEKGIDVLVALACVRQAQEPDIDLVVLASRDTDLVPVIDELIDLRIERGTAIARIETFAWHSRAEGAKNYGHLRASGAHRQWNTNLDRDVFEASLDPNEY